jgi:hypothetical protein
MHGQPINNETLGMTVEWLICEHAGLDATHLAARMHPALADRMRPVVHSALRRTPAVREFVGGADPVDFHTAGGSLSIKTNKRRQGAKTAPQNVGQPTARTYTSYFRDLYQSSDLVDGVVTREALKRVSQQRIDEKIQRYAENLFHCDLLLWFWLEPAPGFALINKQDLRHRTWELRRFSFTRQPHAWNESCTVRYTPEGRTRPVSIGEFQIHNNRDNYKFRFILPGFLPLVAKVEEFSS